MNEFERAVLGAVAKGPDSVGWYKIEQRLSVLDLASREYLPDTLQRLSEQGLLKEDPVKRGSFRVTSLGKSILESMP